MSKSIHKSCKEIYRVYVALVQDRDNICADWDIENVQDMIARLSHPRFVWFMKHTYPSPWHQLIDATFEILHINRRLTNYVKLKKAIDEIHNHPDYLLAKANDYDMRIVSQIPYYIEEFESLAE